MMNAFRFNITGLKMQSKNSSVTVTFHSYYKNVTNSLKYSIIMIVTKIKQKCNSNGIEMKHKVLIFEKMNLMFLFATGNIYVYSQDLIDSGATPRTALTHYYTLKSFFVPNKY